MYVVAGKHLELCSLHVFIFDCLCVAIIIQWNLSIAVTLGPVSFGHQTGGCFKQVILYWGPVVKTLIERWLP